MISIKMLDPLNDLHGQLGLDLPEPRPIDAGGRRDEKEGTRGRASRHADHTVWSKAPIDFEELDGSCPGSEGELFLVPVMCMGRQVNLGDDRG